MFLAVAMAVAAVVVIVIIVVIIVVVVVVISFFAAAMLIDSDAPVGAAANQLPHRCTAGAGCKILVSERDRSGRRGIRLRNEDQVALGVRRHRMRTGRLGDGLDQDACSI